MKKKILFWCFVLLIWFLSFQILDVTYASNIDSPNFTINVGDFTPGSVALGDNDDSTQAANNILGRIIDMLIVAFGALSLFFMTIGAGYMIIYHGQDEFLSRWKSIFMAWLISLAIALSAGMIVKFIAYLLY